MIFLFCHFAKTEVYAAIVLIDLLQIRFQNAIFKVNKYTIYQIDLM